MNDFADRDGEIWLDGEWLPWREARVHVLTHTLHYGCGVFEGLRAYYGRRGTAIFRLHDHTERLFRSAKILKMEIPYDKETLNRVQCEAVVRNGLESAYIRPMCFYGAEGMGLHAERLKVHVMVAAWAWGSYLGEENLTRGIRAKIVSIVRSPRSMMCKAKANGNYLNSILALQEALDAGYDEAILLDEDGFIAEGSGENIFIVKDGVLYTPDLSSALEGITRDTVVQIAKEDLGLRVVEKRISRDELYTADEAFFTGTAAEITPIREVDGRTIGDGTRGEITEKLQLLYFDYVHGRRSGHEAWLTPVHEYLKEAV